MGANWKTTLLGILTLLAAITAAGKALLDGDPATNPDWGAVSAAATAGLGLIYAKDKNVTGGTVSNDIK